MQDTQADIQVGARRVQQGAEQGDRQPRTGWRAPDERGERQLQVRVLRPGAEVDLVGRLDARTAALVRDALHACVDEGEGDLLLHVGSLEIWDASGLGGVVGAHRRARRAGRRVVLTEVPPRHLRLLRATRLHRLFVLEPRVA